MLAEATDVSYEETPSVLEALILEAALIKKHQPFYNVREKDDKSWNYVVITDEAFPRVFTLRERELYLDAISHKLKAVFGPFPHGGQLKDAMKLVRKIFPYRGENDAPLPAARRPASTLYEELGLAPKGAGTADPKEYAKTIRHLTLFFEGRKKVLVRSLERTMRAYAKARAFEAAEEIKRQLFALSHINDVALMKSGAEKKGSRLLQKLRIEAYDVAHISGTDVVGVMTVVEGDEPDKNEYRKFKITSASAGDTAGLAEILTRRFRHDEWRLPRLIVVDGGKAQKSTAERVLKDFGYAIPVVAVTKDERHRAARIAGAPRDIVGRENAILLANKEAHRFAITYHRSRRRRNLS
jgi:excinuclease ABC subunit C